MARCLVPSRGVRGARESAGERSSYEHEKLMRFDFGLVTIQRPRRGAGDDVGVAVEGPAVAGAAELIRPPVPAHGAAEVRTGGFVTNDFLAEARDKNGRRNG